MTKIKTLAEEEMDSHKHWTKNLYEIKPGVWVPKNNTRDPLDLEQRIADLTRQVNERDKRIKELEKENKDLGLALQRAQELVGELTDKVRKAEAMRRPLDTMDEIAYRELEKENGDLRTSIGHRIGRVEELNTSLAEALAIDEAHQKQMGKLQIRLTEVEEDNKKLASQIEDKSKVVERLREKGIV